MPFKLKCAAVGATAAVVACAMAASATAATTTPSALGSMPSGTVTLRHANGGKLGISFDALGLTPGSSHEVSLSANLCSASSGGSGVKVVSADASGRLRTSFTVSKRKSSKAASVSLLLGTRSGGGGQSPKKVVSCVNIPKPLRGSVQLGLKSRLGWSSSLSGSYTIAYDALAHTVTVDISASGFAPGSAHAAHIHTGSCQQQGAVVYMLSDLVADASGTINATRTVSVTSAPPTSGWYLNIHLGSGNQILSGGKPTLAFQPLLCGDITRIDTTATALAVGSGGVHFLNLGETAVIGKVGHFTFTATCSLVGGAPQVMFFVTADTTAALDGQGVFAPGVAATIDTGTPSAPTTAFAETTSSSAEVAADGQELDTFYDDGVNWPAGAASAAHACFAGFTGLASGPSL